AAAPSVVSGRRAAAAAGPRLLASLDLVPKVCPLGRVLHRFQPNQRVAFAGAGERYDGVAETGAVGQFLADLFLEHEIDPGFSQILVAHTAGHGPGVEPGERALLGVDIGD